MLLGNFTFYDRPDNSNFKTYFYYENAVLSDTEFVFKNNKAVQHTVHGKNGKERTIDLE